MADPVSLISIGSTALGAMTSAMGAMYQGQAQSNMASYQAGVARINKQIADQNAEYARTTGESQAQQSGMKTRSQLGTARAVLGASGVDVNTGSAADVEESIGKIGQHEGAVIRSDAAKRAYGYKVEGMNYEAQAGMYEASAANAKSAGGIGMFSSLLGGASSVSNKWLQGRSTGQFY